VGRVVEPTSPKAPEDREWNWHGKAEADKANAVIEHGGWEAFANAHAWYDPNEDPGTTRHMRSRHTSFRTTS
jgi:hypothetical protein